ncbi:MAG: thiamine diphosphokinase [Ruminococcus sp.]|nr:thiamine diphosphokinase [Ruminococcus sp.]
MRCVIISGSPDCDVAFVKSAIKNEDYIICADKGYQYAVQAGIKPNLVVGDFDSCDIEVSGDFDIITLQTHKDDTDTMHAIDVALEKGYKDFLLLGAVGGRFDHTFANISALQHIHQKGANGLISSENEVIQYLSVGKKIFENLKGITFSIFPFGCPKVCLSISGAEYPLNKGCLESSVPMGISNIFNSDFGVVEIYDGNAIIILNNNI